MLPVRLVKEQLWARDRPVRQDLDQMALGQVFSHAISLEVISNSEPV